MNELDQDEVLARVSSYEEAGVTDVLYSFGTLLIAANRDRTNALEGKGMTVAAYGLAVLAFLVSREPSDSVISPPWPPTWVSVAGLMAAVALVCAGISLLVGRHRWFSDSHWFENEEGVMDSADTMKRSHVLAMHAVNNELKRSNDRKADWILAGQWFVISAGLCLGLWVLIR